MVKIIQKKIIGTSHYTKSETCTNRRPEKFGTWVRKPVSSFSVLSRVPSCRYFSSSPLTLNHSSLPLKPCFWYVPCDKITFPTRNVNPVNYVFVIDEIKYYVFFFFHFRLGFQSYNFRRKYSLRRSVPRFRV